MSSESISKSVIWQLIGKFALQGVAFFTTPIFTRILTPENYGTIALYTSWSSILMVILSLQTFGAIATARIRFSKEEMPAYLSSTLSISVIAYAIFFCVIIGFRGFFSKLFGLDETLVSLLLLHSFASYVIAFFVAYLDQHKKVVQSSLISVSSTICSIALALIFVLNFENKVYGKVFGQAIPIVIFGTIILLVIYLRGRCFWNSSYNKYCLLLTMPLVVHGLGHMVFTQADRILLQRFQSESVLGIYSVTYSLCSVLSIIFAAVNTAWVPFYYDFKKTNNIEAIREHSKRYIKLITLMFIGFILLSFDVFKLMAPEPYWNGIKIIPIFVASFYFSYLYYFPVNFEYYHEKTKLIPVATIIVAIINIILDVFLIPRYAAFGAVFATMISQVLLFTFHFVVSRFVIKERFDYKITFFLIPAFIVMIFVGISYFLIDYQYIRWLLFVLVTAYVSYDVLKHRSIF